MGQYTEQAQKLTAVVKKIVDTIKTDGVGTVSMMVILGEMMKIPEILTFFKTLPQGQRDEFFAEVFDQSIGTEPNALVTKVGVFQGDVLEKMTDGIKVAVIAYLNKQAGPPPAA